jgi:polyhydroxyalkanoate synthesis regulator phasin
LADAERQANDVLDTLSSANKESATRKARIRELEASMAENEEQIKALSNSTDKAEMDRLRKIETDYSAHQKAQQDKLIADWNEKAKVFEVDKTNPLFEKVSKLKDRFTLDGEITAEIAQKNMDAYSLLETAGVFTPPAKADTGYPPANGINSTTEEYTFGKQLIRGK